MATEQTNRSASCFLPEAMVEEILVRLTTKALACCRAVSKGWRRLATEWQLLLRHHSRQPLLTMMIPGGDDRFYVNCLEVIDLCAEKRRTILRVIDMEERADEREGDRNGEFAVFNGLIVHGSCDGLLLSSYGSFFVWNPITRQYSLLPSIKYGDNNDMMGFYRHAASGEYRVLYRTELGPHRLRLERDYYVLTVDSQQTRNIRRRPTPARMFEHTDRGLHDACVWPPVILDGKLHCPPPHRRAGDILVFDTDAESFRCISSPEAMEEGNYRLFEMEGKLAMFCWMEGTWTSDLWVMEDYETAIWVCKCRIELSPFLLMDDPWWVWDPPIMYKDGGMLLEGGWKCVLHYDNKGQLQGCFDCDVVCLNLTPHLLKESLVLHEFLRQA